MGFILLIIDGHDYHWLEVNKMCVCVYVSLLHAISMLSLCLDLWFSQQCLKDIAFNLTA